METMTNVDNHIFKILFLEKGRKRESKKEEKGIIPRGSISSDEFWNEGFKIVDQLCDKLCL